MTDADVREAIAAERQELAAVLADLPAQMWDARTLCTGWRVREVVAHMTMPFRYSGPRLVVELLNARGNFNRMADRCARRDAASLPAGELAAALGDNASHPWKPGRGGFGGALTHDVIHLDGIELRADDIDWSFGSGTPMSGTAQDLALVLCGRRLPTGRLRGAPSQRFTDR